MTTTEKIALLDKLQAHHKAMNAAYDLGKTIGLEVESPLLAPGWKLLEELAKVVANKLGVVGWVDWHMWENQWGKCKLVAKPSNGEHRQITCNADLVALIEADQ